MAGIQLSGLASGMDWKTTVDQLMKIEQVPQDTLKAKKALVAKTQSAFDTLKTNMTTLKTASYALQTGLTGFPRSASISAGDNVTTTTGSSVSVASGATIGTYAFDITSLGKVSKMQGVTGAIRAGATAAGGQTLSDYGVSAGTFTVNGRQFTITTADLSKTVTEFFGLSASGSDLSGSSIVTATNGPTDLTGSFTAAISGTTGTLELTATGTSTAIGSSGDTSNFLTALGLSYSSETVGSLVFKQATPTSTLAKLTLADFTSQGSVSGTNALTINGAAVGSFTSASTLGSVISAINSNSYTGVTASVDAVDGRLVLTSNAIGSNGITVGVTGGTGLDTVLGIGTGNTFTRGSGVQFNLTVNGAGVGSALTADSTTIDTTKYGFGSVQFTAGTTGKFNVKVSGSGSSYKSKVNTFISAYNTLRQTLEDSTKITVNADGSVSTSLFSTRTDINTLSSSIRSKMYASVTDSSVNSSYDNISKIGLGFDSSGVLSITDSDKLDLALSNSPSSVDALLNANKSTTASTASTANQGVATRIYSLMYALTSTTGLVKTSTTSLTAQSKRLQTQIDNMTRSLAQTRSTLEASFIAMERAQSRFQSMTQQITSAFK